MACTHLTIINDTSPAVAGKCNIGEAGGIPTKYYCNNICTKNTEKSMQNTKNIVLAQKQCPGDVLWFAGAVREFKLTHPEFNIFVKSNFNEIFKNNPYINHNSIPAGTPEINVDYDQINTCQSTNIHIIQCMINSISRQLNITITPSRLRPDYHLDPDEKYQTQNNYWVISPGYKNDYTAKQYPTEYWQQIVNYLVEKKYKVIQIGHQSANNPLLKNVENLVGQTSIRQAMKLFYDAVGVISGVSFAQVGAGAVDTPSITLNGGREAPSFTFMAGNYFLNTLGLLDCCKNRACWKSFTSLPENKIVNKNDICLHVIDNSYGKCMSILKPEMVYMYIDMINNNSVNKYPPRPIVVPISSSSSTKRGCSSCRRRKD